MKKIVSAFTGFILLLACTTLAVEYGLRSIGATFEVALRRTFIRMALPKQSDTTSEANLAVVAIRDPDFAPPLALSVKYALPAEMLRRVVARLVEAGAYSILVDYSLVETGSNYDDFGALFSLTPGRSGFYHEEVLAGGLGPSFAVSQPHGSPFGSRLYIAPIIIESSGLVEQFAASSRGSLLEMISTQHELPQSGAGALIDFRQSADRIPGFSFSDVLLNESPDFLAELENKTVFVGRATSIFMKGQAPTNLYSIPAPPWQLYGPALQAQMVAALGSNLKLRRLDDTLGRLLAAGWIVACGLILTLESAWRRVRAFAMSVIAGLVALFVSATAFGILAMNLSILLITTCATALLISVGILHCTLENDRRMRQDLFMD